MQGATSSNVGQAPFYPYSGSDKLLFSFYSLDRPELDYARASGVSATGPYYGPKDLDKALTRAAKAQLPLLYTVGPRIDFSLEQPDPAGWLGSLDAEVSAASKHGEIAAWALATEELRHWRKEEMLWLKLAAQTIRARDPLLRPIFMYEPNHRTTADLVRTAEFIDWIAKGTYTNYAGMQHKRTWVRWSVEQAVAAGKQTGKLPVAVLWMARDQESAEDIAAIRSWTRHDVYLSLVTGAKGILIWSGFNKRAGFSKHFKDFYNGYLSAAYELNIDPGLGKVFLRGTSVSGTSVTVTKGPAAQNFTYRKERYTYPTVSFSHLRLGDTDYLFVVNSANKPCTVQIAGLPPGIAIVDALTSQPAAITDDTVELAAYDVRIFRWTHNKPEARSAAVNNRLR